MCAWPQSRKQLDGCLCELCTRVQRLNNARPALRGQLPQPASSWTLPTYSSTHSFTPQPTSQACVGRKLSLPFSLTLPLKGSLPSSQLSAPLSDPASSVLAGLSQEAGDGNSQDVRPLRNGKESSHGDTDGFPLPCQLPSIFMRPVLSIHSLHMSLTRGN